MMQLNSIRRLIVSTTVALLTFLGGSCFGVIVLPSPVFRVGFYNQSCPAAESIVRNTLIEHFRTDVTVPARIIRLIFHECFVTGCDGSILVNSTRTNQAEKDSIPNLTVRGYDVVDDAKSTLERSCPGVVSCADIEVLLAREAVNILGGPFFDVPTGRLDGKNSSALQAASTLPTLTASVSDMIKAFSAKGFNVTEMVTLLGAHTVGAAFCRSLDYRLYNYRNTNKSDPTIVPQFLTTLIQLCPRPTPSPEPMVALDQGNNSINIFDTSFYREILRGKGVLEVDQVLTSDNRTAPIVSAYAGNLTSGSAMNFSSNFVAAFIKLSSLDVITGNSTSGSIRATCALIS